MTEKEGSPASDKARGPEHYLTVGLGAFGLPTIFIIKKSSADGQADLVFDSTADPGGRITEEKNGR